MTAFTIRTADTDDITTIRNLQEKIWFKTYLPILDQEQVQYMFDTMYSIEALADQLTRQQHTFLLIYRENTPIGFAAYAPDTEENAIKLHKIYILPEVQGTGAGKHLLQEVIVRCQQMHYDTLYLNVNRYNKARFFYEKMGFVISKEVDIPFGPYWMNDFIMAYNLQSTTTD